MFFSLGTSSDAQGSSPSTDPPLSAEDQGATPTPSHGHSKPRNHQRTQSDPSVAASSDRHRWSLASTPSSQTSHPTSNDDEIKRPRPKKTATVHFASDVEPKTKTKTSFQLAYPPPIPTTKRRLMIRPRLLLQLQQISQISRPSPTLDVLPSTIFAPRLARRFPHVFRGKDSLGVNDLVIVGSDSYTDHLVRDDDKSSCSEDETWDHRDVVATICQLSKQDPGSPNVEVCLDQGLSWTATQLSSGVYEFTTTDTDGVKKVARWVPRPRRHSGDTSAVETAREEGTRYTFSLIDPSTRRHPILASMTNNTIQVYDRYHPHVSSNTLKSTLSGASPMSTLSDQTTYFDQSQFTSRTLVETDHHLRCLIMITGICVSFIQKGHFKHGRSDGGETDLEKRTDSPASFDAESTPSSQGRHTFNILHRGSGTPKRDKTGDMAAPALARANSVGATYIARANRHSFATRKVVTAEIPKESGCVNTQEVVTPATMIEAEHPTQNSSTLTLTNNALENVSVADSGVGLDVIEDKSPAIKPPGPAKHLKNEGRWHRFQRLVSFMSHR